MRYLIAWTLLATVLTGCGSATEPDSAATPTDPSVTSSSGGVDDPATLSGGCHILVGPHGAVDQALALITPGKAVSELETSRVQDRLFAIVVARNAKLGDAAGQLVDVLDAPSYFVKDGRPDAVVTRTVAKINQLCDSS
jgi:hypothetical protein